LGFNPFVLGEAVEKAVCVVRSGVVWRRYYRFRGGRWYGGIATADCVGCNLRCGFCWSWRYGSFTTSAGRLYPPQEVVRRLEGIASRRGYRYVRVSGGEPTLCFEHLKQVIKGLRASGFVFILETNGLVLGRDEGVVREVANLGNVVVRVSLKGATPEEFSRLTGAEPEFFNYQLRALENLLNAGMKPVEEFYPAVMISFTPPQNFKALKEALARIHPDLADNIDIELVILYPHVKKLLKKTGLKPLKAVEPGRIPDFMI